MKDLITGAVAILLFVITVVGLAVLVLPPQSLFSSVLF